MCDPLSLYIRDTDAFSAALWQLKRRHPHCLAQGKGISRKPFDVRVLLYANSDWIPLVLFSEWTITRYVPGLQETYAFLLDVAMICRARSQKTSAGL
jgi:hypothetical protein